MIDAEQACRDHLEYLRLEMFSKMDDMKNQRIQPRQETIDSAISAYLGRSRMYVDLLAKIISVKPIRIEIDFKDGKR